jgi:Fur family ferric uptake transcriptional regulator/Fur family peroxide stress response transcriptional regulator
MNRSRQRDAVLEYVEKTRIHPTAENVFLTVRKRMPRVSRGTVYRNLHQLTNAGMIREVKENGIVRFDGNHDTHAHLVCDSCDTIIDIPVPELRIKRDGFMVERVVLRGHCAHCQRR